MNLRVAGPLAPLVLFLIGCGGAETNPLPSNTLRVETSNVAWAAYQDGDGLWQQLPEGTAVAVTSALPSDAGQLARSRLLSTNKTRRMLQPESAKSQLEPLQAKEVFLNITDAQGRYGLAYVCLDNDLSYSSSDLSIRLSTLETDADRTLRCYDYPDEATYTLSGTVKGLGADDAGYVYTFIDDPVFVDALSTAYSFELEQDVYDVIATRYSGDATAPNKVVIQNDVTVDTDQTLDLDFEGEAAFTPDIYTATITDVTGGLTPSSGVAVRSKNYTLAPVGGVDEETSFDYGFIPAERLGEDAYLYTYATGSNDAGAAVSVSRALPGPGDFSLALPEPLAGVTISAVQGATLFRYPTAIWDAYAGEDLDYDLYYFQLPDSGSSAGVAVYFDEGWLSPAASLSYTLPDLSAVPGWNSAWNLKAGEGIYWYVGASLKRNADAANPDYIYVEQSGTVP